MASEPSWKDVAASIKDMSDRDLAASAQAFAVVLAGLLIKKGVITKEEIGKVAERAAVIALKLSKLSEE